MNEKSESEKLDFLRVCALELGASDAKIIAPKKIVIEDRVLLKRKFGCSN